MTHELSNDDQKPFTLSREPAPVKPKPFRPQVESRRQTMLLDRLQDDPNQKALFAE